MNIRTITEVPGDFKHMLANAEAFGEAMRDPLRSEIVQTWMGKDKKPNRGESDAESTQSPTRETGKEDPHQEHMRKHPQKQISGTRNGNNHRWGREKEELRIQGAGMWRTARAN